MDYGFDMNHAARERIAYLHQQAEQDRLAHRVLSQQRGTVHWSSTALIWIGKRLSQWGQQLERRREIFDMLSDTAK